MTSSPDCQFLEVRKVEPRRAFQQSPADLVSQAAREGRPRPLIALITPTPQIEQGNLSPCLTPRIQQGRLASPANGVTPRIPLGELDQSQLSQRLFQSPRLGTSPGAVSPSLLLTNQLPSSVSPGRRRHYNTERQINELKQQVEQLAVSTGSRGVLQQQRLDQLEQEREELEQMLEEKEQQMEALKSSVAALNAEYIADLNSHKQDSQSLEEELNVREEKLDKLETEHQKSLKTIQGLRFYIRTLPPAEEVEDLKAQLDIRTNSVRETNERNIELEISLKEVTAEYRSASKEKLSLEIQNKELLERVKELSVIVKDQEKVRLETRNLDETGVELLAFDKNELEQENQKLKNILDWKTTKFEEEKNKLEDQVKRLGGLLEKTNKSLQGTNSQLREKNLAYAQLEVDLKTKTETMTTLAQKLERVGAESCSISRNKENSARLENYYARLARSMGKCLGELHSLMDLANQVMDGGNPNLSVLLGVNGDISLLVPQESPLNRTTANLTMDEKLVLVRQQVEEVAMVQEEISGLRRKISDTYSDKLAENMSCLMQ